MGYLVEVQFFNTFILRSEVTNTVYIEESRIKGGFNEPSVSIGPKAHLHDENYAETRRDNALIYSGVYNSRTDVNRTNVFNSSEPITRAVDPSNGSIQKLHAEDTNLNIFQEDKVSYALIDKDALFTAEGGRLTASGAAVIGQIVPYLGKYGISKNPESFAIKGMRKYFADKNRAAIIRLSRDGITEISRAGMRDFFKDNLKTANKIVGAYDDHADEYVVSIQNNDGTYETLSYDETSKGWVSFYDYGPDFGFSLNKDFYTIHKGNVYKQYANNDFNKFYGLSFPSTVTLVANAQPNMVKNFNAITYEGSDVWEVNSALTDLGQLAVRIEKSTSTMTGDILPKFVKKENKYYSYIMNNDTSDGSGQVVGVSNAGIKGFFSTVKMSGFSEDEIELFDVSHNVVESS